MTAIRSPTRAAARRSPPLRTLLGFLLAVALLAGGCRREPSGAPLEELPIEDVAPPPDATASLEADPEGRRRAAAEVAGVLPGGFPVNLPLYRPSSLVDFGNTGEGSFVLLFTPDPPAKVRSWLVPSLSRSGWSRDGDRWSREGRPVRIVVSDASPGTEIRIEY